MHFSYVTYPTSDWSGLSRACTNAGGPRRTSSVALTAPGPAHPGGRSAKGSGREQTACSGRWVASNGRGTIVPASGGADFHQKLEGSAAYCSLRRRTLQHVALTHAVPEVGLPVAVQLDPARTWTTPAKKRTGKGMPKRYD